MRRALIAVLFALLPLQVLAHAQLRASDPAEGAVLARSPVAITLSPGQASDKAPSRTFWQPVPRPARRWPIAAAMPAPSSN